MKAIVGLLIMLILGFQLNAQCPNPTTMMFEDFEGPTPIVGAITSNIYGNGSWNNASMVISGSNHGWFNVVNGIGDVDVYNRNVTGFCPGLPVELSFWTRESYGGTNVTFSAVDDLGVVLASQTLVLNSVFQQITFNFNATTTGLNFIVHCNSTGGNGLDIVLEDILIVQCLPPGEDVLLAECDPTNAVDLFTLFSPAIGTSGTWSGPSVLGNGQMGSFDPAVNIDGLYTYTEGTGCNAIVSTVDVNYAVPLDLGPDTVVCNGTAVTLDAGAAYDTYEWSNNQTTQSINVLAAGTYSVEVGTAMGNIVQNGDFEGGTTAATNNFTTSYNSGTGGAWGLLSNPGEYAITTSPNLVHNNFPVCSDHTTGTGNMFVANGASTPNTVVWTQTVPVTPNTEYMFSFWAMRVSNDPATSDLQLFINGTAIGPVNSTGALCNWGQIADTWNSVGAANAVLSIVNQSTSMSGNDFALDDIVFAPLCVSSDTIVVSVETLTPTITTTDPSCNGVADGEIHISTPGAVEFSIDGGTTWQVDSFFLNLSDGAYNVCSRSTLGCVECQNIVLNTPPVVTVSLSPDITICENGSTDLVATGGGGVSFDYHWDFTADLNNTQNVSPTTTTTYFVVAENENGCFSLQDSVTVTLHPPIAGTISPDVDICFGDNTQLVATASGGMGAPYTFTWSTGDINQDNTQDEINVSPTDTTTYTVTINDNCESTPLVLTTTVNVIPLPVPQYIVTNPDQCEPATFEIVNNTDPNQSQFVTWLINGEQEFLNQDLISSGEWMAGNYDIQMTVTSPFGCVNTALFPGALNVDPIPNANFTFTPNPPTMFNTEVLFNNSSIGADTYQWNIESGNPATSTEVNPQTTFPDGTVGTYEVELIAISDLGCTDTMIREVQVYPEVLIYAPNTFTPDGDEFNQGWQVFMEGIDRFDYQITLYNRWGQIIWESKDVDQAWDGTYNGKPVQDGTYTWRIWTKDILNDNKYTFEGHVNVIR